MPKAPGLLLDEYCKVQRGGSRGPEDVLLLLRRQVLRWTTPSPFALDNPEEIAVLAPEDHYDHMQRVICSAQSLAPSGRWAAHALQVKKLATIPFFYRLNFIRQLATTSFSVNIEANHNRLAHCLGVTDCAAAFLESIEGKGTKIDDVEGKAILLFAFFHDMYHGPFGHMLDMLRDVLWQFMAERADKFLLAKALIQAVNKKTGPLWLAVREHLEPDDGKAVSILAKVLELHTDDKAKNYFATEIIDAAVDADRLDYLWRDAQHLMRPSSWSREDGNRIVSGARVITTDAGPQLFFDVAQLKTIEKLLEVRNEFYTTYYESPLKHILEEMFAHALYYALSEEKVLGDDKFAEAFALLVDDDLVHFMWEVLSRREHLLPLVLMQDALTNRPFGVVWKHGIPVSELPLISRRYGALQSELQLAKRTLEEKSHRFGRPLGLSVGQIQQDIVRKFVEALESTLPYISDEGTVDIPPQSGEQLFWLQNLYGNSFKKKLRLEAILWKKLLHEGPAARQKLMASALEQLSRSIMSKYFPTQALDELEGEDKERANELVAATERMLGRRLQDTPLVFVSLSWIPGWTEAELLAHSRGFGGSDVRFHRDGKPIEGGQEPEIRFRDRDEDYVAMVSAPDAILKIPGTSEAIADCFDEMLKKNDWLWDE